MSKFKGTPGPWEWFRPGGKFLPVLRDSNRNEVCNFGNAEDYYPTEGEEPGPEDALLISKAPEMLAMLERIAALQEEYYGNGSGTHLALLSIKKEIDTLIENATKI